MVYTVRIALYSNTLPYLRNFSKKERIPLPLVIAAFLAEACTVVGSPWRNIQAALDGETIWEGIHFIEKQKKLGKIPVGGKFSLIETYVAPRYLANFEEYQEITGLNKHHLGTLLLNRELYRNNLRENGLAKHISALVNMSEKRIKEILSKIRLFEIKEAKAYFREEMKIISKLSKGK